MQANSNHAEQTFPNPTLSLQAPPVHLQKNRDPSCIKQVSVCATQPLVIIKPMLSCGNPHVNNVTNFWVNNIITFCL